MFLWLVLLASAPKKKTLFKEVLPGTAMLSDSFYVDKTPVTVIDYLEFLSAIKNSYSPKMHDSINTLPNWGLNNTILQDLQEEFEWDSIYYDRMLTRCWLVYGNDEKVFDVDIHIKNPRFYNYPLINVNYMQVTEYCKWRTDMVKIRYAVINDTEKKRRRYPMNFKYRLASKKEWDQVLGTFFNAVDKLNDEADEYEKMMNNLVSPYIDRKVFRYNSRNVAEMLDRFVVTTGFAWNDKYELGNVSYVQYQEPSDWIGFRCVCEVIPEKVKKVEVIVLRDKFGKIIDVPEKNEEKAEEPSTEVESKTEIKEESNKSKKKKTQTQSMSKKRRKFGKK